ncbi:MAG: FtsX-like permease family protein [Bryobacteraceae bacterium]
MMLRLLTLPYVRKHKLRSALTLAGIVLGVAVFVGMHTANRTVSRAFQRTIDRIAGKTQLQVTAGETGFPEQALEKVQDLREVGAASPVIEAVLSLPGKGNILVLGVDMTGDRSLREYDLEEDDVIDDPLVFLAQPDSLILSGQFARANGIVRGQKIEFGTMEGPREFTVRGIMKAGGLASAFGGNVAVMDVYAAQLIFGRGRMFDRIDIAAAEGVEVEACRARVAEALGAGYEVEAPSNRGRHFDSIARGLAITVNITSLFALLIGVFLIYNSFSIAITQRRTEIGILRALGASRRTILGMFIGESALAGAVASAIGVWMGLLMAHGVSPFLSYLVREVYGNAQVVEEIAWDWKLIAVAMAICIG